MKIWQCRMDGYSQEAPAAWRDEADAGLSQNQRAKYRKSIAFRASIDSSKRRVVYTGVNLCRAL